MSLAVASVMAAVAAVRPVRRLEVVGPSMLPTLAPGDRVLAVRGRGRVRVGDLAVVRDPTEPSRLVVKRVLDVAGGLVTVRGDNAHASTDSRTYGPVDGLAVWGRAVYRYYPPERRGAVP